jgi:hypothetical protein
VCHKPRSTGSSAPIGGEVSQADFPCLLIANLDCRLNFPDKKDTARESTLSNSGGGRRGEVLNVFVREIRHFQQPASECIF